MQYFSSLLASFFAVLVVLTLHEFSHAFVAVRCGDPTPKWNHRLTLNPLRHCDPLGLLCFVFVRFGWAKPVPVNPYNFKKRRLGMGLTAVAGIAMNYLTAFLFYPLFMLVLTRVNSSSAGFWFLYYLTQDLYVYSICFCVFNLLPFYPLDGFRIVEACSKHQGKIYRFLRQYGYYVLLFLIVESFICSTFVRFGVTEMAMFDLLGWVMEFATGIVGWPISALWGLVPW